jgi:hypothetical protein
MEKNATPSHATKTTPRDFFFWLGAIIALYASVTALITLLFEYVNYAFPDALAGYGDPYGGAVRFSMAMLIVMVPVLMILFRLIRGTIIAESAKEHIWVRRWAIVLTLFIAALTILIDLVTLINTFLGGEISVRFGLKVAIVLLIALGVFLHFLADQRGYWIKYPKKANWVGIAVGVLAAVSVISGFFIIGTPTHVRMLRFDEQKVQDLQSMQYQVTNYYQVKRELPETLDQLSDPLSGYTVPLDPQSQASYEYVKTDKLQFSLCAVFNEPSPKMGGKGSFPQRDIGYLSYGPDSETWQHEAGRTCFERTLDPERYPPLSETLKGR